MSLAAEASQLELKLAVPGDEDLIASLILKAFLPFKAEYTEGAFKYTAATADTIRDRFAEGPMWIAYDRCDAVGRVPDGSAMNSATSRCDGAGTELSMP